VASQARATLKQAASQVAHSEVGLEFSSIAASIIGFPAQGACNNTTA
jgi:hypothetical protein